MNNVSELPLRDEFQPPMANGEVLFDEPWQGRVFAMTLLLVEQECFAWDEFQAELIEVIHDWEASRDRARAYAYYEHFQEALKRVLASKNVVASTDLDARTAEFAARPHGHDH
ncbi:MAG: nitrile hydratase accessory protein [Pseudomonadales bacterium]